MMFLLGFLSGSIILEPIIINFLYLNNIDLFNNIILSKNNRERLREYYVKKD